VTVYGHRSDIARHVAISLTFGRRFLDPKYSSRWNLICSDTVRCPSGAARDSLAAPPNLEIAYRYQDGTASIACYDGWRIKVCEINWEDEALFCEDSGKRVESAGEAGDG
jgi:hypothetical protein